MSPKEFLESKGIIFSEGKENLILTMESGKEHNICEWLKEYAEIRTCEDSACSERNANFDS